MLNLTARLASCRGHAAMAPVILVEVLLVAMIFKVGENGAPGTIRTSGPQIRSLMLYPAELRVPTILCDPTCVRSVPHIRPERGVVHPERFERPALRFVV
jgi:hypothetical protein